MPIKLYQKYPSENQFYCEGSLVTSKERDSFHLTLILLWSPEICFIIFIVPYLLKEQISFGFPLFLINIFLFSLCFISLLLTSYMDPGIIPRGPEPPKDEQKKFSWQLNTPASKTILIGSSNIELKHCVTCNIYRPPRSHHCSTCGNCVDRFDHHCPWTANCIGKRNYRTFLFFVYSIIVNCLIIIACIILKLFFQIKNGMPVVNWEFFVDLIIGVYCLGALIAVGLLGGLHCILVATNQTTNEYFKNTFSVKSPFSLGCFNNFLFFWCPPYYPNYIHFGEEIDLAEDDKLVELNNSRV